jgi:hypothetical protein
MTDKLITTSAAFVRKAPSPEYRTRMSLAADLTVKARDLRSAWGPQASNPVKNRGERLHKIIWQGRQWAVTTYGVECRDGCYAIGRARLWEEDEAYSWVRHMAEKNWVDLHDFAEALRIARSMVASSHDVRG